MRKTLIVLAVVPFLAACAQKAPPMPASAPTPVIPVVQWLTYSTKHYSFEYPSSWKLDTEIHYVMHYRSIHFTLNSMGRENFYVDEVATSNGSSYNEGTVISQLKSGAVCVEFSTWNGPGSPNENLKNMEDNVSSDITAPLLTTVTKQSGVLATRDIHFCKWGRNWTLLVRSIPPISTENEEYLAHFLKSFRFPDFPAGDEQWAVRLAHQKLPADSQPELFTTTRGGSPSNFVVSKEHPEGVLVNFVRTDRDKNRKVWKFLVTTTGEVRLSDEVIPLPIPPARKPVPTVPNQP